jgi:hypothetical protein
MKIKNQILTLLLILIVGVSCGTKTGKVGDVNTDDISYFKDGRTNVCFAIVGAKKGTDFGPNESTSIGMACVPCEQVEEYLEE